MTVRISSVGSTPHAAPARARIKAPIIDIRDTFATATVDADAAARVLGRTRLTDDGEVVRLWKLDTGHYDTRAFPTGDGRVFEGGLDGRLRCLDADGKLLWEKEASWNGLSVTPAVAPTGNAYVSRVVGVEAYSPDGAVLWQNKELGESLDLSCAAGPEGSCYVQDHGTLYALDGATGEKLWQRPVQKAWQEHPPVVGPDGTVYVADRNDVIHAFAPDGTEKWRFEELDAKMTAWRLPDVTTRLAVGPDGTVYFGARKGTAASGEHALYAVKDGRRQWVQPLDAEPEAYGSPAVDGKGNVYCGSGRGREGLCAFQSDGTPLWKKDVGPPLHVSGTPDGGVVYGIRGGDLHRLGEDGAEQWTFRTGNILTRPAFGRGGELYTGSGQTLYAIRYDTTSVEARTAEAVQQAVDASSKAASPPPTIHEEDGWIVIGSVKVPRRSV